STRSPASRRSTRWPGPSAVWTRSPRRSCSSRARRWGCVRRDNRAGNLTGRVTTYAEDHPVFVVRFASRGGGEVLRLHLQEFEDREGCSLRRSRTRTQG